MALIEFENDDKYFIKFFLLDATLNLNRWGVTEKALRTHLNSFIGKPFVLTPDFDHPKAANGDDLLVQQEKYRVGDIIQVGIERRSGKAWGLAEIKDKKAAEILKRGDVNFVSPSIVFDNINEEYQDGNSIITSFNAAHVAGVKEPAYGVDKAEIKGKCAGGSETCLSQLSRVQASRSKCGRFTTIKVGKKEIVIAANDCVERCIKKKVESGKDIDEQALAICHSECGESDKIKDENPPPDTETGNITQESLDNITEKKLMKKKNIGVTEDEYNEDTSDKPKKITKGNDMKRNLFAEEKDEKEEADDPNKLDLTDEQEEYLREKKEDSKRKAKKSRRAEEDEEKRHEREMSKADDEDEEKEDAEDDEDEDKKEASLRSQVRSLKSELKALKAKVKSAEVDPLIDQILEAKSQLGKIDERVEYAKLSKLDISTLHDLADNYSGIVQARTSPRFTVRQASVDSSLKGDSIFKKISEGYD